MALLTYEEIKRRIDKGYSNEGIFISPILDQELQLGASTFDFRLGLEFLVSIQGRAAYIDTAFDENLKRPISSFFVPTRRRLGEPFILHPNQIVLGITLEYIKLPGDIMLDLSLRSSFNRLGLSVSAIVQPGYTGCVHIEVVNPTNNSIRLLTGMRFLQGKFLQTDKAVKYGESGRKYRCNVRPKISSIYNDEDMKQLLRISRNYS